jgi:ATP-binding cassette subfamily B protein
VFRETAYVEADAAAKDKRGRKRRTDLRPLRRLLPWLAPYRWRVVAAFAALTLSAGTVLALGMGLETLIDRGLNDGNAALLDRALLVLLGVIAVLALASFARFYFVSWIGERVIGDLRSAVYRHIVRLHPGFYETNRTAEIISRLTADTTVLQVVVGSTASIFLRNLLMLAGGTIMLLVTSAKLTGLVLLVVPLVIVPIVLIGRRVRRLSRAAQDRVADVGAYVDESLHAIRTVQAHAHEGLESRRFGERVEGAFAAAVRRVEARAALTALVILMVFGAIGVILWTGGHDVLAGRITGGELSAFVFYAVLVAGATGALSEVVGDMQRAAGAAERLFDLLETEPEITAPAVPVALPAPARGAIGFERVTFHYPSRPDESALEGFGLAVAPGESLALVGPSGAGKTTVFQLLLRFYDPQAGTVRLDGVDVRRADPQDLRARIGLVPQDPVIFSTTAAENIRYGRPEASDGEVRAAAEAAHAWEFVRTLPDGFDTFLGERGVRLSGGQRQRIALARAILRDPAVLLLDEATSALDAESELKVQQALRELMRGRTTIVIAHRLATVQNVDRIAVLDHGRLVATGSHAELIRQGGLYARLAALQFDLPRERIRLAAGE